MNEELRERWKDDLPRATPDLVAEAASCLAEWQDSTVFLKLHAMIHACVLAPTLKMGEGNQVAPHPEALRNDAADLRIVVDTFALFLEALADRIEAKNN
jgi:hypothetical protein